MDLARWQEVKRLVEEALDLPGEERPAYLEAIADPALREEAEALLAVSETLANRFDDYPLLPDFEGETTLASGERFGEYEILRPLGQGGMGRVYLARDIPNDRGVALKILGLRSARLARFEHRALARLTHPNIATLYASGTSDTGIRYVAMEYVDGVSVATYCERHCPTLHARLALFQKICAAVAYAHQKLVVHRDLKPGNILVTADGEPKLLDFGIAKLLPLHLPEATLTGLADRPLTLAFASPEQLSGEQTATATDIYSLGVLLSFLLTGRLPYRIKSTYDLPWAIRNLEPVKPSEQVGGAQDPGAELLPGPLLPGDAQKLRRLLEGDIDAIVLKTLRKEPDRRYPSVAELGGDIGRYLNHESVLARRGSRAYRAAKFVRRHRQALGVAILALVLLAAFALALLREHREALRQRDAAREEATRAETAAAFLIDMFKLPKAWNALGHSISAHQILDQAFSRLAQAPPPTPEIRGTLKRSLGTVYLNLGLYTPAEALLHPALTDLEQSAPVDPERLCDLLFDLGRVSYQHGRFAEAEGYATRALAVGQSHERGEHRAAIHSLLGQIAFAQGAYRQALERFRAAADLRRAAGWSDPEFLSAENDLACTLHEEGKLTEAEGLHDRVLAARRKLFGNEHPDVLQSLHNLARLREDEGKLPEAEALYRQILAVREALSSYDLRRTLLLQSLGALLTTRGRLDEAALRLEDSFSVRRRILPDEHPDIARSLAELGRLAQAKHRYPEAEAAYRQSLERLRRQLGESHPDTLTVANNLGALLAETGRAGEAEGLWQGLLKQAAPLALRPRIPETIAANLALLPLGKSPAGRPSGVVPYQTLAITTLDLSDFGVPDSPPLSAHANPPLQKQSILFFDDFSGKSPDPEKWEYGGDIVAVEAGQLQIRRVVTDSGGWARTRPISINPTRPVVIRRRVKLHAANRYFDASLHVNVIGYPEKRFGVSYANYHYTGGGETEVVGFSLFRHDTDPHRYVDRVANASRLLPPVWDRWFDEQLVYDPRSGEVRYSIDGTLQLTYNVDSLPPGASTLTIAFDTWGWYTGHYQYLDSLVVGQ
jgi:tetratricopeptide (TPR) repeat protein